MSPAPSTTIAVLTYLRPNDIATILPALVDQADRYEGDCSIMVIDNDPAGSARETVAAAGSPVVQYVHEPTPGISAARNRAIDECTTDLIVFIDDDERPTHDWLGLLVEEFHRHPGTLGVRGFVESVFAEPLDPWIEAGRFFERLRPPTGTEIHVVATNNLLLDRRILDEINLRFDPHYGLIGGSDTLFSHEARLAGYSFRFHSEAVVYDAVPASRATREWVLKRAYRSGNSWSLTTLAVIDHPLKKLATRLTLTASGAVRIIAGSVRTVVGRLTRSMSQDAQGMRNLRRGSGLIAGAWGRAYAEYARSA